MIRTTKDLKDAVEARIDIEQRKQVLQILAKDETLDEQTTEKLQQLISEIERREAAKEIPVKIQHAEASGKTPEPQQATMQAPDALVAGKAALSAVKPPDDAEQANTVAPKTAPASSRDKELAELERKNAEMSQRLEQLTREKQNTLMNHLAREPDLDAAELAYRAHHVTERLNKDEPGLIRLYLPLILLLILAGVAAWAFFKFIPVQSTL